jgi:hypothetical protein
MLLQMRLTSGFWWFIRLWTIHQICAASLACSLLSPSHLLFSKLLDGLLLLARYLYSTIFWSELVN